MKKYLKYVKCYGGYVLAVGAGCTFSTCLLCGIILLIGATCMACRCSQTCCKLQLNKDE